jgi:hypothetical protein
MVRPVPTLRRLAIPSLLLVFATACSDHDPVAPADPQLAPSTRLQALACTVQVRSGEMNCSPAGPAAGGVRGDVFLGRQNLNVRLRSSGVSYDAGTGIYQADVTVQNLLSWKLGTVDGSTPTGIRVFFGQLPTVTAGTGGVEVASPDGTDIFTASNQPYFLYGQVLAPRAISAPHTWRFSVPATVVTFEFVVFVAADLQQETGVLRWLPELGPSRLDNLYSVWASAANDAFSVG